MVSVRRISQRIKHAPKKIRNAIIRKMAQSALKKADRKALEEFKDRAMLADIAEMLLTRPSAGTRPPPGLSMRETTRWIVHAIQQHSSQEYQIASKNMSAFFHSLRAQRDQALRQKDSKRADAIEKRMKYWRKQIILAKKRARELEELERIYK